MGVAGEDLSPGAIEWRSQPWRGSSAAIGLVALLFVALGTYAALVARSAPRGIARHYDSDHFAIYHPPLVDSGLADQTAFLQEHFGVDA